MKYITTKAQFLYIFGNRTEYLRRKRELKRRKRMAIFLSEEKEAREIEERSDAIELKKIMNWNGQVSADLQYNGEELKYFKYILQ